MYDFKDIFRSFSATLLQSNTPYSNMLPTHRHATRHIGHIVRYFGRFTRFGAKNSNMTPTFGISLKIWFHFCEVPSGTL